MRFVPAICLACVLLIAGVLQAQELTVPQSVTAGSGFSIPTSGSGSATFYLMGPSHVAKREAQLGAPVQVKAEEVRSAGRYLAILRNGSESQSATFFVTAAAPANLSFLAHPSRVPVARKDSIIAVAFVFDKWHNLVRRPEMVDFRLEMQGAPAESRQVRSSDGVAWTLLNSGRRAGNDHLVASAGGVRETRVIQQVASDPCNLRIKAVRNAKGVAVETDPVRDCSGNPVSDGTVVTFTATDSHGRSMVDVPIKKDVARATLAVSGPATISVASGVVMGNEVRVGGGE